MFTKTTYQARRQRLAQDVASGLVYLPGNKETPRNYAGNIYPFRQDSNFRYFAGHDIPALALTIDAGSGASKLWGEDTDLDHVIWMGEQPGVLELAERIGADYGGGLADLEALLRKYRNEVHFLPPYRAERKAAISALLGKEAQASEPLIRAVIDQRSLKSAAEIEQMSVAVSTSMAMHAAAHAHAAPGQLEHETAGLLEGMAIAAGGRLAYPAIVTRNGHILHNHYHGNVLRKGDLLLIDAGAESTSGYAGDITRTFAIGAPLSSKQADIYRLVDKAKRICMDSCRPGVPFSELHDLAGKIIFSGLSDLGLTKGDPNEAVAAGAHALFMPHGLGHMIGLDVHDMEDLGEDLVGYDEEFQRSTQFGTRNLRLGRRLREGYVITVEPGIYFIPALMDRWQGEGLHTDFINYGKVNSYRDFGGIRLEDNVAITAEGSKTL